MQLANPVAFTPFLSSTVVVRLMRRAGVGDTLKLNASVVAGDPYQVTSGDAAACSQYSVSIKTSDIVSPSAIVQGSVIDADPIANAWPKLTVQRVYSLGGMTILNCSANERGVQQ